MNRLHAGIVLCCLATPIAAAAEPLAELRDRLRQPYECAADRGQELAACIRRPYSLLELSEALVLVQWRDNDPDDAVARVDRGIRESLFRRFEDAVQEVLAGGAVAEKIAVANLVGNIGVRLADADSCRRLGRSLGTPLAALCAEPDPLAGEAACRALAAIHPPAETFLPAMQAEVNAANPGRRLAAVAACTEHCRQTALRSRPSLSGRGLPFRRVDIFEAARDVIPVVIQGLRDAYPPVRSASLNSIQVLATTVADVLRQAGTAAQQPLSNLEQAALDDLRARLAASIPALALSSPDVEERLLTLQTLDRLSRIDVRIAACMASTAGRLHDALVGVVLPVAQQMGDRDVRVRIAACQVLEDLGAAAAPGVAALEAALRDPCCFVRWSATRALGKIETPPESAIRALAARLNDPDVQVRLASAASLGQLGNAAGAASPALIAAADLSNPLELRIASLRALDRIGAAQQPAAQAVFARALADSSASVREWAVAHFEGEARTGTASGVLLQPRSAYADDDRRVLTPPKFPGPAEARLVPTTP